MGILTESQRMNQLGIRLNEGISLSESEYLDSLIEEIDSQIAELDEDIASLLDEEDLDELSPKQRELKKDYKKSQTTNRGFGNEPSGKDPLTYGRGTGKGRSYTRGGDPKRTANATMTKGSKYKKASKTDTNRTKDMIKHNKNGPSGNTSFMAKTGGHKPANLPADRGQQAKQKERQKQQLAKQREKLSNQRQKLDVA